MLSVDRGSSRRSLGNWTGSKKGRSANYCSKVRPFARLELTRQGWDTRASGFEIVVSKLVREESSGGDAEASGRRMAAIENIPVLKATDAALALAERLVSGSLVPQESAADALHIAVAAVSGMTANALAAFACFCSKASSWFRLCRIRLKCYGGGMA